jgi:hypothetical protein
MSRKNFISEGQRLAYVSFISMISRCYYKSAGNYPQYGGRGVEVCAAWRNSFAQFFADMGPREKGQSLERMRNSEGYTPDNCCWASSEEQNSNRSNNIYLWFNGKQQTLSQWSRELGIPPNTLSCRHKRYGNNPAKVLRPRRGT